MSIYDNAGVALIPSGTKASKLYSVLPANGNGDFNATRGSTATRVNKDGLIESVATNVPRLNYPLIDGVVQDCPALLLEPQRTNLINYSEAISNTPVKSGTFTDNFAISPDGSQNATKLTAGNTDPYFYQSVAFTAGDYTASLWVKGIGGAIGKEFRFAISNETHSSNKYEIPSEWTRFEFTATITTGTFSTGLEIPDPAVSGDEVLVWGWQLEAGSYKTSYIKTSGGQATRSADVCNGSGTSAEFNDSEGVFFVESAALISSDTSRDIEISDGNTNRIIIQYITGAIQVYVLVGGSTSYTFSHTATITQFKKISLKYKENDFALWIDGFEVDSSNSGSVFGANTLTQLDFFKGSNQTFNFYGKTKQVMTFKTALNDSELETLTSWDSFNAMATGQLYTIE